MIHLVLQMQEFCIKHDAICIKMTNSERQEPEPGEVWGRDPSFGDGCWYQVTLQTTRNYTNATRNYWHF